MIHLAFEVIQPLYKKDGSKMFLIKAMYLQESLKRVKLEIENYRVLLQISNKSKMFI